MLNIEVCKKCHRRRKALGEWQGDDDLRWHYWKVVRCPINGDDDNWFSGVKVSEIPPDRCESAFEHAVAEGASEC